jgi:hypothetical protein
MPLDEQGTWPLDAQGMWIHSEFLEGRSGTTPAVPDPFLPNTEMAPLPDLPEPPKDLLGPAAAP